jgi:hypothetical protein
VNENRTVVASSTSDPPAAMTGETAADFGRAEAARRSNA